MASRSKKSKIGTANKSVIAEALWKTGHAPKAGLYGSVKLDGKYVDFEIVGSDSGLVICARCIDSEGHVYAEERSPAAELPL